MFGLLGVSLGLCYITRSTCLLKSSSALRRSFRMQSSISSHSEFQANDELEQVGTEILNWIQRIETSIVKSRKIKGGNYVQIATVDTAGLPHCRTVVFRGFLKFGTNGEMLGMKMITDARSEKIVQMQYSSACEMVWWFSQSSEQYRVAGELQAVGADCTDAVLLDARKQQWGNLSDPAREQFYWRAPGVMYEGAPSVPAGGRDAEGKVLSPPENFLLLLLTPKQVKYLRLRDNLAMIDTLSSTGNGWDTSRVNP